MAVVYDVYALALDGFYDLSRYVDHRVVSLEIPDNVGRQQEKSDDKHEAKLDVRAGKIAEIPSNR